MGAHFFLKGALFLARRRAAAAAAAVGLPAAAAAAASAAAAAAGSGPPHHGHGDPGRPPTATAPRHVAHAVAAAAAAARWHTRRLRHTRPRPRRRTPSRGRGRCFWKPGPQLRRVEAGAGHQTRAAAVDARLVPWSSKPQSATDRPAPVRLLQAVSARVGYVHLVAWRPSAVAGCSLPCAGGEEETARCGSARRYRLGAARSAWRAARGSRRRSCPRCHAPAPLTARRAAAA